MTGQYWSTVSGQLKHVIPNKGRWEDGLAYCFNGACKIVECTGIKHAVMVCSEKIGEAACGLINQQTDDAYKSGNLAYLNFPCANFGGQVTNVAAEGENPMALYAAVGVTAAVAIGTLAYYGYKKYQGQETTKAQDKADAGERNAASLTR